MAQTAFILILTEDEAAGQLLRETLRDRYGHSCSVVTSVADGLASIRARAPDVVVTPAETAAEPAAGPIAALLDSLAPDAALVMVGDGELPLAKHVGVSGLPGTLDPEVVAVDVSAEATKAVARREDRLLQESMAGRECEEFEGIVGVSPAIRKIVGWIKKAARNKLTVLILGETGTGKDLIAEAIHRQSDRANKPFKPLNCAGVNENLLESELFGHVRGSSIFAPVPAGRSISSSRIAPADWSASKSSRRPKSTRRTSPASASSPK